ncbi:RNA-binding S4 domain-containing protein [Hyphobacterium sp. HN65]|uniref:RNA-binding S4 domain-containing protein n=1 Tax=Hyphobacterium lacteum TaxID=3116575 RepID=A0ABU7LR28_9PROT|nr:RNA-binding S4 domain-containing protein [Hyphobacterium sp. HN65]MEE2526044.1 RNA-binding S4 domain-containing protein [Hyphobacterium sp. HN65]
MSTEAVRIDIWLWRARFVKTRALATGFVGKGRIRIGEGSALRRIEKPSTLVRPGDSLTFPLGSRIVRLTITALGERRGPASEARGLYDLHPEED